MAEPRPFHRLFGLSWIDFLQGTALSVETETDTSLQQQFLDLVLIRRESGPIPQLPDGFEELAAYNLVTFKSFQEALDAWALCELIGHYVSYRKLASASSQELLPEADFRLFAVCARFPQNLAQQARLTPLRPGVYELRLITLAVRIVVVNQLPQEEQNAMLHLFSAQEDLLQYGKEHYRPRSPDTSTLLYMLLEAYEEESSMPEKLKEWAQKRMDELLQKVPPEERLKGLSPKDILKALPPETREALRRELKSNGEAPILEPE